MKYVIFTDETRATLDGPDGWSKGWVGFEGKLHHRFRRHQGYGGAMLWAGIIDNELVGPIMVREGVKINNSRGTDKFLLIEKFMMQKASKAAD